MEYIQNVFVRLFQRKTQSSCTDVSLGQACGFNKQGACPSRDVGECHFEVKRCDISGTHFQETVERLIYVWLSQKTDRNTIHLSKARVELGTLHTSGSLAVRTAPVDSTCLFLRKTNASRKVNKHSAALFYSPNQDVRMAMQGDFQCLLDDDGFKQINIQIQRRSERHGRTPGLKDSNLRSGSMMKTETMSTPRRRLQGATLV